MGAKALAKVGGPIKVKMKKNTQTAMDARADVPMLRKTMDDTRALAKVGGPIKVKMKKNTQTAMDARADVAMLRKTMDDNMAIPNQKETYMMLMTR
jgi:hypothetical protein